LITNAIKYSPSSNKIVVHLKTVSDGVQVSVQDFGVGIPLEKQSKVFERFYRVSGPKEDTFPGLGLGLYISSEIIKRQGGKIWVESIEKEGSTFGFTLPFEPVIKKKKKV
jgi:signal transduction histidine kinase